MSNIVNHARLTAQDRFMNSPLETITTRTLVAMQARHLRKLAERHIAPITVEVFKISL